MKISLSSPMGVLAQLNIKDTISYYRQEWKSVHMEMEMERATLSLSTLKAFTFISMHLFIILTGIPCTAHVVMMPCCLHSLVKSQVTDVVYVTTARLYNIHVILTNLTAVSLSARSVDVVTSTEVMTLLEKGLIRGKSVKVPTLKKHTLHMSQLTYVCLVLICNFQQ